MTGNIEVDGIKKEIRSTEEDTHATPAEGISAIYAKTDKNWYALDSDGVETPLNRGGPSDSVTLNLGADLTTTSTSFVDVDSTNLSLTITTNGGDVLVGFTGSVQSATDPIMYLNVAVDDVSYFADDGLLFAKQGANTSAEAMSFVVMITGLSAGTYKFELQWKTQSGTIKMFTGAGTATVDVHHQFWVLEV